MMQAKPRFRLRGWADDPPYWSHTLLTASEERALARRVVEGDPAARDELILKNQKLVIGIAKRFLRPSRRINTTLDDLVSAGNRGLIHAVKVFDPERGLRFSTCASRWIYQAIQREVRGATHLIHLPEHAIRLASEVERIVGSEANNSESVAAACVILNLSDAERETACCARLVLRADHVEPEEDHLLVDGEPSEFPEDAAWERKRLHKAIKAKLTSRQYRIVARHYGLDGWPGESLAAVARRLGACPKAVRRDYAQAIEALRNRLPSEYRALA